MSRKDVDVLVAELRGLDGWTVEERNGKYKITSPSGGVVFHPKQTIGRGIKNFEGHLRRIGYEPKSKPPTPKDDDAMATKPATEEARFACDKSEGTDEVLMSDGAVVFQCRECAAGPFEDVEGARRHQRDALHDLSGSPSMGELPAKVYRGLRQGLLAGEFGRPGVRMPTHIALGKPYGVSHATVSAALRVLESQGLVEIFHGGSNRGTYVGPTAPATGVPDAAPAPAKPAEVTKPAALPAVGAALAEAVAAKPTTFALPTTPIVTTPIPTIVTKPAEEPAVKPSPPLDDLINGGSGRPWKQEDALDEVRRCIARLTRVEKWLVSCGTSVEEYEELNRQNRELRAEITSLKEEAEEKAKALLTLFGGKK